MHHKHTVPFGALLPSGALSAPAMDFAAYSATLPNQWPSRGAPTPSTPHAGGGLAAPSPSTVLPPTALKPGDLISDQREINNGVRTTLSALRSTIGSQGAILRGVENMVGTQQSQMARLVVELGDVQAAASATSTPRT